MGPCESCCTHGPQSLGEPTCPGPWVVTLARSPCEFTTVPGRFTRDPGEFNPGGARGYARIFDASVGIK
eukprot:8302503-Pyramimonas_sp.AAC.2